MPDNAILNNGGDSDVQQGAPNSSGEAARLMGQEREDRVANIVNGSTSGEKVAVPGMGSTDIDVVAPNGDLIAVGGPAKGNNLGKLGQELRIYQTIADQRGVSAQVYFAEGTPQFSQGPDDGNSYLACFDSRTPRFGIHFYRSLSQFGGLGDRKSRDWKSNLLV